MTLTTRSAQSLLFTASILAGLASGQTVAQNADPASIVELPLVVMHTAGLDRLQQRAETVFSSAGRDDMAAKMQEWLTTSLRDLKGLDRTRPLGVMIYLKPGLSGLAGVGYFPVQNLEDFLGTLSGGTGNFKKVEDETDRYEITNEFGPDFVGQYRNGYLFLVADNDATELDRKFPAPEKLVQRLNSRYDVAVSLMIKSIPPATRQLFVTFLQTQTLAELQQKDDEPESAYRVRKANGENALELIEKIISQGEELTLGGRIDEQTGLGEIDLEVSGTPDSKLAKFFQGMVGRRSLFANLLQQPSMMMMAMSWQLDEKQRKAMTELLMFAPNDIERQAEKDGVEGTRSAFEPIFQTLLQSAEAGHLDGFVQLAGEGEGGFALLAGVRVVNGANLPRQFAEALRFAKDKFSGNDRVAAIELESVQIDGLPVHYIPLTPPDKPGQWMFGEGSRLYAYATTQALWISFGGDEALTALKAGVVAAKKPVSQAETRQPRIPFIFQTRASQWVAVQTEARKNDNSSPPVRPPVQRFREEVQASFDGQNDGLRVEVRPTDSGARVRFEFQKGWVGLLGRMIALQMERAQAGRAVPAQVAPPPDAVPTDTVQ